MKKLIVFLAFLLIQMSLYSQSTWMNSNPNTANQKVIKPLTPYDTMLVAVRYRHIVAARMLYRDWCGLKKVENQQLYTIQTQERQIKSLVKQIDKFQQNDSIATIRFRNDSILIQDLTKKFNANKRAKIGASISVPIAAVISFLLGWYLHR